MKKDTGMTRLNNLPSTNSDKFEKSALGGPPLSLNTTLNAI